MTRHPNPPPTERAILTAIDAREQLSVPELADRLDTHPVSVARRCDDLQQDGSIRQTTSGRYTLTETGTRRVSDETETADEIDELQENPKLVEKAERYDDRHREARETANPDDHRDEPPNDS